jgi:hypothetical protein
MVKILKSYTRQSVAKPNPYIQNYRQKNKIMLYFYNKKGAKIGPIHIESLKKLAESKKINPETIITDGKGKTWEAREMPELKFNEFDFFVVKTLGKLAKKRKRPVDDKTLLEKYATLKTNIPTENKTPNENKNISKNKTLIENKTKLKIRHKINWEKIALNTLIVTTFILIQILIVVIILNQLKILIK